MNGIPLAELIGYMWQAAQAIDYLNEPRHPLGDRKVSIQHRDIKPENILLAANVVKVGDFGLAKVLEGTSAVIHGDSAGLTLAYAAPEMFTNLVTRWSDQYSLAITYYRLRTGVLPFPPGSKANDIIKVHVRGFLELSRVGEAERAVLARATAVKPEERIRTAWRWWKSWTRGQADGRRRRKRPDARSRLDAGGQRPRRARPRANAAAVDPSAGTWTPDGQEPAARRDLPRSRWSPKAWKIAFRRRSRRRRHPPAWRRRPQPSWSCRRNRMARRPPPPSSPPSEGGSRDSATEAGPSAGPERPRRRGLRRKQSSRTQRRARRAGGRQGQ